MKKITTTGEMTSHNDWTHVARRVSARAAALFLLVCCLALSSVPAKAQCTYNNTAFKGGERLSYKLYFNWKFIWITVGTASFDIDRINYHGQPAFRGSLITRTSQKADKYFVMRDTLLCYNTMGLAPLYYRKGAKEGKRYTVDEVFYSYPDGRCHVRQHRLNHHGKHEWRQHTSNVCLFDMMSIFLRARSYNPASWKSGHEEGFTIADGRKSYRAKLRYLGKTNIKADNGHTYRCLKLAYLENDDGKGYKKIVDFFITDDSNHVPVRLDLHLRFGSAKAYLTGMSGLRGHVTSLVK